MALASAKHLIPRHPPRIPFVTRRAAQQQTRRKKVVRKRRAATRPTIIYQTTTQIVHVESHEVHVGGATTIIS